MTQAEIADKLLLTKNLGNGFGLANKLMNLKKHFI